MSEAQREGSDEAKAFFFNNISGELFFGCLVGQLITAVRV
jgi:hypothetical protein